MTLASGALEITISLIALAVVLYLLGRMSLHKPVNTSKFHRLYKRAKKKR